MNILRTRLVRVTGPFFWRGVKEHRWALLLLIVLSIALGVVPTLKSELESGLMQHVSDMLRQQSSAAEGGTSQAMAPLAQPLRRFEGDKDPTRERGLPERLADWLFSGLLIVPAVLLYCAIAALEFAIALSSKAIQARAGKSIFGHLRDDGMRKSLYSDPSQLPAGSNLAGQHANAIQQGATSVSNTWSYTLDASQYLFALGTTLLLVATKNPLFAALVLALVAAQAAVSLWQARRLHRERTELDRTRNLLVAQTDEALSKREILAAYEQQDVYARKLDVIGTEYADIERRLEVGEQRFRGLSSLLMDFGRVAILLLAVLFAVYFGGASVGNVGDAYFLVSIYIRMLVPANNLLSKYDSMKRSEATSNAFLDLLETKRASEPADGPLPDGQWQAQQPIRFDKVSFKYRGQDARQVLEDFSLTIPPGKTTLLLGPSGCGKSTIARLILKFWPPSEGGIRVGGRDIAQWTSHQVRSHMSYVSQGDHIVDETVRENMGWTSATQLPDEELRKALASARIATPHGYEDLLDVPAKELSLGQQQRLSVARVLLDQSEIVIMDEPLAGTDVFTFRDMLPLLTQVLRERQHTVLMISHRLAFASCADHVVVLDSRCRVLEQGSPVELLARRGTFAELHAASTAELRIQAGADAGR
ncbi:ABC transporter ATP-binding protein [Pseudorhodoferax sp.]|uniref:ABC transporter ATP-binding protein n=1 Tax=Pseudorhodoferax sp. TaxID=1993553 RepID=UPI002DD6708E|nr:ABC transporter ATP-binding protein [Pseudorhodoferax sp.]